MASLLEGASARARQRSNMRARVLQRQREKQRRVRCRERTVTMFYASADRALKKFTYALAELLVGVDAAVVALVLENLSMFFNYKVRRAAGRSTPIFLSSGYRRLHFA